MKANPRKKKVGIIPKLILLVLFIYTAVVVISMYPQIQEARERLDELERKVELQRLENELLKASNPAELTDEIIANIVRDKLGYVLQGETLFRDEAGK